MITKERLNSIKENVYMRSEIAKISGLGIDTSLREELELIEEIDRLNNIINEIKEYIKYQIENLDFEKDTKAKMLGCMILNMLKELKDSDKE